MAIEKADGTVVTKASGESLITPVTDPDPLVQVNEAVYETSTPSGTTYPPITRQLKFRAGQQVKRSTWDACFPAATVSGVTPSTGPAAGGTPVEIHGSGFTPDATVQIGGTAATSVKVITDGRITAITPAGAAGAADVKVTTDAGDTTATGAFTYA